MATHKTSAELKYLAKEQLLGHYLPCTAAFLMVGVITFFLQSAKVSSFGIGSRVALILEYGISFIIQLLLGVLVLGQAFFYLHLTAGQPVKITQLFYGFSNRPDRALKVQLFSLLLPFLPLLPAILLFLLYRHTASALIFTAACLALAAGGVFSVCVELGLSQSFYILLDFPEYTAKQALHYSRKIMKGNKGRLFYIEVSFIPYYLLCLVSFGLGCLFVMPYLYTTRANFYLDLMRSQKSV